MKLQVHTLKYNNCLLQDISKIPFLVVHHGRNEYTKNTMGLLIDYIPIVFDTEENNDKYSVIDEVNEIINLKDGTSSVRSLIQTKLQQNSINASSLATINFTGIFSSDDNSDSEKLNIGEYKIEFDDRPVAGLEIAMEIREDNLLIILPYVRNNKNKIKENIQKFNLI